MRKIVVIIFLFVSFISLAQEKELRIPYENNLWNIIDTCR